METNTFLWNVYRFYSAVITVAKTLKETMNVNNDTLYIFFLI